jgi:hypothetical protein
MLTSPPFTDSARVTRRRPLPALLSVNHESRCTFLADYLSFTIRNTPIYIHPILDTLAISSYTTDSFTLASILAWPLHQLTSIACPAPSDWLAQVNSVLRLRDEVEMITRSGYTGVLVVGLIHGCDLIMNYSNAARLNANIAVSGAATLSSCADHVPFEITQADNMALIDLYKHSHYRVNRILGILEVEDPNTYKILRNVRYKTLLP